MGIFERSLSAMPDIEERKKIFFFNRLTAILKMSETDDYHWILYACCRATVIVSLLFATVTILYLYFKSELLTEEIVVTALRFFTVGKSFVILSAVLPYYYYKTKNIIGFSKIDFLEAFPENRKRVPRHGWAFDRKKIIRNTKYIILLMSICLVFGWTSIVMIINHYEAITSLLFTSIFITVYSIAISPAITFLILFIFMINKQYKDYFDQMPKKKYLQGSKK